MTGVETGRSASAGLGGWRFGGLDLDKDMKHPMQCLVLGWWMAVGAGIASASGAEAGPSMASAPPVVVVTVPSKAVRRRGSRAGGTFGALQQADAGRQLVLVDEGPDEEVSGAGGEAAVSARRAHLRPAGEIPGPGKFYAVWLNSEKFHNFKDATGTPAVPYLLTFRTAGTSAAPAAPAAGAKPAESGAAGGVAAPAMAASGADPLLNPSQRQVLEWTDRQFRGFFDGRTFDGWSDKERSDLAARMLDTLKGPVSREYYRAINTLIALRATNALPALRTIGLERREKGGPANVGWRSGAWGSSGDGPPCRNWFTWSTTVTRTPGGGRRSRWSGSPARISVPIGRRGARGGTSRRASRPTSRRSCVGGTGRARMTSWPRRWPNPTGSFSRAFVRGRRPMPAVEPHLDPAPAKSGRGPSGVPAVASLLS